MDRPKSAACPRKRRASAPTARKKHQRRSSTIQLLLDNPRRASPARLERSTLEWQNAPPAKGLWKASACSTCEREDLPRKAGAWSQFFVHIATRFWVPFASHQLLRLTSEAERHVISRSQLDTNLQTQYTRQGASMAKPPVRKRLRDDHGRKTTFGCSKAWPAKNRSQRLPKL